MLSLPLGIPMLALVLALLATIGWMVWEPLFGPNEPFGEAPPGLRAVDAYRLEGRVRGRPVLITGSRRGAAMTTIEVASVLGIPPDSAVLKHPQVGDLRRELGDNAHLSIDGLVLRLREGPRGQELLREVERAVALVERYEALALQPWTELAREHHLELEVGAPLVLRRPDLVVELQEGRVDLLGLGLPKALWAGAKGDAEPVGNPVLDLLVGVRGPWPSGSEEALLAVVHGHPGSTVAEGRVHLVHEGSVDPPQVARCLAEVHALMRTLDGA